jgi:predicted RNase H-like HicB family nuclease
MIFSLAIHKDEDSDYGVTVLDLPGCFTAEDTLEGVIKAAKEAIECHIEAMLEDGEPIPEPKPIEYYKNDGSLKDATFGFVEVDISKLAGVSERINITIPKLILRRIDAYAKKNSLPRSTFIANAAIEYIKNHKDSLTKKVG